jgi:hypothetical protein
MNFDLKEANKKLAQKRSKPAPLPPEVRELAVKKARLEAKVSHLEREVRKQLGSKPAVTKAPAKPAAKKVFIEPEEQARLERLYIAQEERKKLVSKQ